MRYTGEIASLLASVGWAGSALFFEYSSRRIGSRYVNLWRLLWAFLLIGMVNLLFSPSFFHDVGTEDVLWLLASGCVGFFVGDVFLFWSFVAIGSRLSLLIMLVHPFVSAVVADVVFGEVLSWLQILAMVGTLFSIGVVLFFHHKETKASQDARRRWLGVLAAVAGMLGQAGGALLARPALVHVGFMFEATWIRVIGGLVGFVVLILVTGAWRSWLTSFRDTKAMVGTVGGSVFGPLMGVTLFLVGMKYAPVGVATTLSSLAPILLLGVDRLRGKKLHPMEIPATLATFGFLYLFFV